MRVLKLSLFLLVSVFILGACRGNSAAVSPEQANITLALSVAPPQPAVGDATLIVTVRDADNQPINNARVAVRGDMNHAGMQPVLGNASVGIDGDYRIPFTWTMGGDWFVVVTVTLADGTVVERQFDYSVSG